MKLFKNALLLGGLCLPAHSFADVTLDLPKGLEIVALNGKNANIRKEAVLPDGLNQLAVRFTGEFGSRKNNRDLYYSDIFVVSFEAHNEKLFFQIPEMRNGRHLRAFNRNPDIHIMRAAGSETTTEVAKLEKEGLILLRDYEQELKAFNRSDSPAAVSFDHDVRPLNNKPTVSAPERMSTAAPTKVKQNIPAASMITDDSPMAEKMLQYWFEQADEETKRKFLEKHTTESDKQTR